MKDGLPIAIVGCGYWGCKHVRVARDISSIQLAMAVDRSQDRLDRIRSQYPGVAVADDFRAILASDVVGVIIATPISTHASLAKAALMANKHVLVEKPMATTSSDCRELISIAKERKRVLMVGHTFEYHPAVQYTRDIVQQGGLGNIYYIGCRRLNLGLYQADANVLWDLAPHDFSIVFSILGERADRITAWGCSHIFPGIEDVVFVKAGFPSGVTAHLNVSWLDPVKTRQVTIVGSDRMLIFDDVLPSEKVRIYERRFKPAVVGDSYADFQSAYHHGDVHIPSLPDGEPLKLEVLDFVSAIATNSKPCADGQSGLQVVEALEAASASLLDNSWNTMLPLHPHADSQTFTRHEVPGAQRYRVN